MKTDKLLFRCPTQPLSAAYKLKNPSSIFDESLYISSPEFYQEYLKRTELEGKENEKLELSLAKYWIRSSSRCTPYASFAGCSLANITVNETQIILANNKEHYRKIRVDMNYTTLIIQALLANKEIQNQVPYFPNNSLYSVADVYRYAEYDINNNTRSYQLTAVAQTEYLNAILQQAKSGKKLPELVGHLSEIAAVSQVEAEAYIEELCASQILIADIEANVTGAEPFDVLIEKLKPLDGVELIVAKLRAINKLIKNPKEGVAHFQQIEQGLKELELVAEIPKNTLQVDLFLATKTANFEQDLIDEIIKQTADLKQIARQSNNPELDNFKKRFYEKYEDGEVPLFIVMDADLGIGYAGVAEESAGASPLVDNLIVAWNGGNSSSEFDYIKQFTLTKYHDYLKNGKALIEIEEDELKGFAKQNEHFKFPNSQYLFGSLHKKNGKINEEYFSFHLFNFGAASAGNLFGRFTQGDEQLCMFTKELLAAEEQENPDAIYAEIAHLPQARIGNILLRPVLRKYEIPYIGKSGAGEEQQIKIEDLWVKIVANEIVLWSKKHNKRIIPRLTTAHNFSYGSLPIYKFLCDLQAQGIAYPNIWDWGHLESLKQLPRVVYKNIILKKARWKISETDIKDLPKSKEEYFSFFEKWRAEFNIPKRVVYAESDNELLIDFEEEIGFELFLHYLRKRKNILLEEFLFTEENCIVRDEENRPYTNEIIIPIHTETKVPNTQTTVSISEKKIQQKFAPFSEWIYFKVYCGNKSAEQLLRTVILQFVENGLSNQLFEHFFFIRYKDDFSHIRIRFYNTDIGKQKEVFSAFSEALKLKLESGLISKIVLDTYNRELERYGDEHIEAAEQIFYADSIAVMRFLALLEGTDEQKYRMLFALRGIDMLLSDYDFSLEEKHAIAKQIQTGFFKEFGAHPHLQKQLNEKYRSYQKDIFSHLDTTQDEANEIEEAVAVFHQRSENVKAIIKKSFSNLEPSERKLKFNDWLPSYIHMFMNRLYLAQQRKYELVVYHFLEKYYASQLAIKNQKNKQKEIIK